MIIAARTTVPTTTRDGRRSANLEALATGEESTRASALRPGNGPWHQKQTVAVARPTTPQRGHDARCGGRRRAPPQALQYFESAALRWSQDGQRVVLAEKTRVARR